MAESMQERVRKQLQQSVDTLQRSLAQTGLIDNLVSAAELTAQSLLAGHKLLLCGNGGSAADAQHLAAEFVSRLTVDRPPLRAIALTTDSSAITAIGNDYGYEHVFARQVEALGQRGDVLLAISTSGNSPNVLRGLETARALEIQTIGLTGGSGGAMAALCDLCLCVPSMVTMNIQESHLALEHVFCMLVERCIFGPEFAG